MPPPGPANVGSNPPRGNSVDCNVQIRPHPWNLYCILEEIGGSLNQKIKIPPLFESVQYKPIPIPDPAPLELNELAAIYPGKNAKAEKFDVESHRFGTASLHAALTSGGFNEQLITTSAQVWKGAGLDLSAALGALQKTNADVSYEQIECLGIDDAWPERLVATFRIKRPYGYSGNLCQAGSQEYIAFWADWDNTCKWRYQGTVAVNVHDISSIPSHGLCYSRFFRSICRTSTGHARSPGSLGSAVLSWAVPPSTTNPDALNYWGNRLDAHVQLNPGQPDASIRNIGGIALEDINTSTDGMTKTVAFGGGSVYFAHYHWAPADGWGLNRECPFGGNIVVEGLFFKNQYYRILAQKVGDPTTLTTLDHDFWLGSGSAPASTTRSPAADGSSTSIRRWSSTVRWPSGTRPASATTCGRSNWKEPRLRTQASIISSTPWYRVQLDNTAPGPTPIHPFPVPLTMDIHITSGGGDCKDVTQGDLVVGYFIADDVHFGGWGLRLNPTRLRRRTSRLRLRRHRRRHPLR